MRSFSTPSTRRAMLCLACLTAGTGCTHNHYYTYDPCGTPAAVVPGTVQYGSVCEVPSRVIGGSTLGGSRVAAVPSDVGSAPAISAGTPIGARSSPPRVVVSEPLGRGRDFSWRPADPEAGPARTRITGAIDDSEITR